MIQTSTPNFHQNYLAHHPIHGIQRFNTDLVEIVANLANRRPFSKH